LKRRNPFSHLWGSEKGLSAMLVFLCLALFIGAPLSATLARSGILFDILFSLMLVFGVVTVARRPALTIAIAVLTLATLVLRWGTGNSPSSALRPLGQALSILLLAIFTTLVLVQVFQEGPITGYRIQGAIVVYLLMGLMWSAAYELVLHLVPGAFNLAQGPPAGGPDDYRLVYYSYVTLTTIGYGDITPLHPAARSLAMAEGLVGQLYPAILIARLVSMELETRRRK
jgi:hypothetical protein